MIKTNPKIQDRAIKKAEKKLILTALSENAELNSIPAKFVVESYPDKLDNTRISNFKLIRTNVHTKLIFSKVSSFVYLLVYSTFVNEESRNREVFSVDILQSHKKPR